MGLRGQAVRWPPRWTRALLGLPGPLDFGAFACLDSRNRVQDFERGELTGRGESVSVADLAFSLAPLSAEVSEKRKDASGRLA